MQKDVHFYMTYALARKAGIGQAQAEIIAWADQFTDELTQADLYGIQTQSAVLGNWSDRQVQMSVLVPFHFIPGMVGENPWLVVAGGKIATDLAKQAAESGDPYQLGIALHALQDTFSHQGFTGWREDCNSCYPWWYISSLTPNVGHAEMGPVPDIASADWTDPRTDKRISNPDRIFQAALATCEILHLVSKTPPSSSGRTNEILVIGATPDYDVRKQKLRECADAPGLHYKAVKEKLLNSEDHAERFITAARRHLSGVLSGIATVAAEKRL